MSNSRKQAAAAHMLNMAQHCFRCPTVTGPGKMTVTTHVAGSENELPVHLIRSKTMEVCNEYTVVAQIGKC